MSCNDIWAGVQNGSLFCAPSAAQRAEFISCAVERNCKVLAAKAKSCSVGEKLFFLAVAAIGFEARVQQAACVNQPAPGGSGQPCAPGTACCPQCQSPLLCSNGTCCAPPPFPGFDQQALPGCPCAPGLTRNGLTGACCPQPMTAGSPCTSRCPCPQPMTCVNGTCKPPCPSQPWVGSPCSKECPCPAPLECSGGICCNSSANPCDPFGPASGPCPKCTAGQKCHFQGSCLVRFKLGIPPKLSWSDWMAKPYCNQSDFEECLAKGMCQVKADPNSQGKTWCAP